ncbi:hypothetical protein [Parvularcula sp. LCG005]|uniref:hypothetical protein n=1 Tax=Parvularcula sp. LCG005 TaxID=3078805 RepID=UPI0029429073|nr:hypothetical protein [Parvularcula sp. LCG005]WOI54364.1 hypothetical protein RUI03_05020 [Parvularcula sp. LCG005]
MVFTSSIRRGLFATSACAVLAACSGSGNISSTGSAGPVTIGGGNSGGGSTADVSFVPNGFTCPTGTTQDQVSVGAVQIEACIIPAGTIVADTTLPGTSGNARVGYFLQGAVFVGDNLISNPSGSSATLSIGAGAIIMGANGEDALFINPGSDINAVGTELQPIVMTSATDAADGNVDDGLVNGSASAKGEWGGLVINGLAPINDCDVSTNTPGAADCNKTGEGGSGLFGGNQPNDSSGTLSYVRVQYAGFRFNGEDELNGIAFQGVGDGTTVDHIHVHNGNDDGVEFFGGTVNVKNIVVTGADDDSIDWTDGWQGDLQFALVVQDDVSADRGIEGDNRGNDVNVGEAQGVVSRPNISNFTFFGSSASAASPSDGLKLRAGTGGNIANGIVLGFGLGDGLDFDRNNNYEDSAGNVIGSEMGNATPSINALFFADNAKPYDSDGKTLFDAGVDNTDAVFSTMSGVIPGSAEQAVNVFDNTAGTTLTLTNYIGAFDPASESNSDNWMTGWTLSSAIPGAQAAACPAGTTVSATETVPSGRFEQLVCVLPNQIDTDITLTSGNLYTFAGSVFIGGDVGPDATAPLAGRTAATLTVEPGVTVYGSAGEDAIIVTRGSQLVAEGTSTAPVIFTSKSDIDGTVLASDKGEWGGLVINGRAPINDCNVSTNVPGTIGCEKSGEGSSGLFGGNDENDDSGSLSYVQVKYAGFRFNGEDELNGIAFQGVGDATNVDHVHVHNGNDDGVEFFGGTVNVKNIIVTGADDDSIDWTDGWRGSVQYALVIQDDVSADRGIEGDNRGNDVNVGEAQGVVSTPTISNFTFFGSSASAASPSDGVKIRAGTDGILLNGIVLGFGLGDGIDFDRNNNYEDSAGNVIGSEAGNATPELFSIYVADNSKPYDTDGGTLFNVTGAGNVEGTARNMTGFIPNATLQGAIVAKDVATITFPATADNASVIDTTDYVGAFDPATETNADNWTTGWSYNISTSLPNVN